MQKLCNDEAHSKFSSGQVRQHLGNLLFGAGQN